MFSILHRLIDQGASGSPIDRRSLRLDKEPEANVEISTQEPQMRIWKS
jgi:hypothetical protein